MGRKAAQLKSKSVAAIPFPPHDGPIFHNSSLTTGRRKNENEENHETHDDNDDDDDNAGDEIRVALNLLASSLKDNAGDHDESLPTNSGDPSWILTRKLCQTLKSAGGIKDQLQALQSYRSTILNWKQPKMEDNSASSPPTLFDESLAGGLYRLFLEWSLSADTPLPLQRVLHSCIHSLDPSGGQQERISTSVLESLWAPDSSYFWKDPLHALDVAINSPVLSSFLQTTLFDDCVSFMYQRWAGPLLHHLEDAPQEGFIDDATEQGHFLVKLLKTLLQDRQTHQHIPFCDHLEALVVRLMKCPTVPTEAFNTLGIVYAKLHLQSKAHDENDDSTSSSPQSISKAAILAVQNLKEEENSSNPQPLSMLARLSIVQGIAATLDLDSSLRVVVFPETKGDDDKKNENRSNRSNSSSSSSSSSTPLEECWKYSLHASQVATDSMDRWAAIKGLSTLASRWRQYQQQQQQLLPLEENSIAEAPSIHKHQQIFDALIQETLDVVLQAWENPPLRKLSTAIPGIFQTLVQLLPPSERQKLCRTVLDQPLNRKGRYLALEILLPSFGADNNDTSLIRADSLLEGVGDRGPNSGAIADLWIKLLGYSWNQNNEKVQPSKSFLDWTNQWVPSLSRALVDGPLSRRKQVAAFCIVRLVDWIKKTKSLQDHCSESMVLLWNQIGHETSKGIAMDRILWAHLDLARHFYLQKVMTQDVKRVVANHIPPLRINSALCHELSSIRLAAFRSLQAVVENAYNEGVLEEAEFWKSAMPYSIKTTDSKEYTTNILHCLMSFLDRFSAWEAGRLAETRARIPLQNCFSFASDFVVGRLVLKLGAYPGTVVDKEEFTLILLESLLAFVLQDHSFSSDNVTRNGIMFQRKRQDSELVTMSALLRKTLVQQETFAAMFSLLQSPWDGTRAIAFRVLSKLVVAAHMNNLPLPEAYSDPLGLRLLKSRGLYLASSPRQREADTGSRLLAFVYISTKSAKDKHHYLSELVDSLDSRLSEMKQCLKSILQGEPSALDNGRRIPLAHGIINAILLTVQHQKVLAKTQSKIDVVDPARDLLYAKLIGIFCSAIELSLNIVADLRDGESLEGVDETVFDDLEKERDRSSGTPLNVNTGAIGANGNFSKLAKTDQEVQNSKLAVQRVVVGTWLLTKETCAAASAVIAAEGFDAPSPLVQKFGTLLISTLTSLKHAGAAFSARDSLQEIALVCLRSYKVEQQSIPEVWVNRLLNEMCSYEKVRDSTLRRSTGYALGFLALMRSELVARTSNSITCFRVLTRLVAYSLPAENELESTLAELNLVQEGQTDVSRIFVASSSGSNDSFFLPESLYEERCRVHALNVLRMIILDAPLADAVRPFIGDAIVSSLLGYSDSAWAVRNSATMVFSAAMLRVIDSDKNASNTDQTSSRAVTMTELYRRYPTLSTFLPAMMKRCLVDQDKQVNSQLFPILQLLSRTQPIVHSGGATATEGYPDVIRKALNNKHHAIRAVAARSLANVCSDEIESQSSFFASLKACRSVLMQSCEGTANNFNQIDGCLLAISSMLRSSSSVRNQLFDLKIDSTLEKIIQLKGGSMLYPPSCISAAVDVLAQVVVGQDGRRRLTSVCVALIENGYFERLAGGALLYESATKTTIMQIQCDITAPKSAESFAESLTLLQSLLTSNFIDVRFVAAKCFKKSIYECIDRIVLDKGEVVAANQRLLKIAAVVLLSLETEMNCRSSAHNALNPHIPTLRRLSRCFLECFDGYQKLSETSAQSFLDGIGSYNRRLWQAATTMVEHEQFLGEAPVQPNGEIFLSGNAAELMSIQIAANICSDCLEDQMLQTFEKVIGRLNDSQASWRSRFSAVKAIENSRTLSLPADSKLRRNILREMLEMLQDSDPDVRSCAARAASQVEKFEQRDGGASLSALPVPTLCNLYPVVFASSPNDNVRASTTIHTLLETLLGNSRSLAATMQDLDTEMQQTRDTINPSTMTNNLSRRNIFEEEDPNPFNERLLSNQLAVQALLQFPACEYSMVVLQASKALLRNLSTALTYVCETNDPTDLIHEMSRFPAVFPSLHGLLCATAASIFLGIIIDDDQGGIQRRAQDILQSSQTSLHPEILCATKCLLDARRADEATKTSLEKCLFLLSSRSY